MMTLWFFFILKHVEEIVKLEEGGSYKVRNLEFSTPILHIHDCETYGIRFQGSKTSVSYISDTKYFEGIESYYSSDVLILNVVLVDSKDYIHHLSISDAERIIQKIKPKIAILTHFGLSIIKARPWDIAEELSKKTGCNVIAASDGMLLSLDK